MPLLFALALFLLLPAVAFADPSLYRSEDAGRTWAAVETAPPVQSVFDLVADPTQPGRLMMATDLSLWESQDGGGSWTQRLLPGEGQPEVVFALAVDPDDPARLWAASERGVWTSDDGGVSWRPAGEATPTVVALIATVFDGRLRLIGGGAEGLLISDDEGATWVNDGPGLEGAVLALAATPEGDLLVGTTSGLYARAETEAEFAAVRGLPRGASRAAYVDPEGITYAAVGASLYRRGNGWVRVETMPLAVNGDSPAIAEILRVEDRLLIGTDHALHSSDEWKPVPPFDQLAYLETAALVADPAEPSRVFLGSSTVPNSIGYARVGVVPNSAVVETPDERLTIFLGLVFLLGGVFIAVYYRRLTRQESTPPS